MPFGVQPATHEGFAECGGAEVAGVGPCNQHLTLLQQIFISLSFILACYLVLFSQLCFAWQKCCCSFIWSFVKVKDKSCWPGLGAE